MPKQAVKYNRKCHYCGKKRSDIRTIQLGEFRDELWDKGEPLIRFVCGFCFAELEEKRVMIVKVITEEENKFNRTIDQGMSILQEQ